MVTTGVPCDKISVFSLKIQYILYIDEALVLDQYCASAADDSKVICISQSL